MKRLNTIYWVVTALMAAMMGLFSVPDVLLVPEAVALIKHLGYPVYFLPYIGVLKILGVVAVLLPMTPSRLKEWAYAGLIFDVVSALYSAIAVGDAPDQWVPPIIALSLIGGSYALYRQRQNAKTESGIANLLVHS